MHKVEDCSRSFHLLKRTSHCVGKSWRLCICLFLSCVCVCMCMCMCACACMCVCARACAHNRAWQKFQGATWCMTRIWQNWTPRILHRSREPTPFFWAIVSWWPLGSPPGSSKTFFRIFYHQCDFLFSLSSCISLSVCYSLPVSESHYLCLCLSVSVSVCLSVCLSVYLSVCLSVCLSVSLSLSLSASVHRFACLLIYISVRLFVCQSLSIPRDLIILPVCLSVYLSLCHSLSISVYLSITCLLTGSLMMATWHLPISLHC